MEEKVSWRRALSKGALAVALVLLVASPHWGYAQGWKGRGDFEFFLDEAAFRGRSGASIQEIFLRIPNDEIRFRKSKGKFSGKVRILVTISDSSGRELIRDDNTAEFFESVKEKTTSTLYFQTVVRKYALQPGRYKLLCRVEDMNSPKVTLVAMIKGKHKVSVISDIPLEIPSFPDDAPSLSDPMFLWSVDKDSEGVFYHPNPPRMYGLYKDTLMVYFELYLPVVLASSGGVHFEAVLLDQRGNVMKRSTPPLDLSDLELSDNWPGSASRAYPIIFREDLTNYPAGTYTLYVNLGLEGHLLQRIRCGGFTVAWELRTWEASRRDMIAEARFLLEDEDFEKFKKQNRAEQEKILQKTWRTLDPDPSTGINEAYEKFLKRLEYVNARYSDYQLGILTDRGLVYMKYGRPDEVIVDVIPLNRETTSDAIDKVRDRFQPVVFSTHGGRMPQDGPSRDIIMDRRRIGRVGEGGNVAFPYELWVYNGHGDPIIERDKVLSPDIGIRFIFVDREGYGHYRLEVSSSLSDN